MEIICHNNQGSRREGGGGSVGGLFPILGQVSVLYRGCGCQQGYVILTILRKYNRKSKQNVSTILLATVENVDMK